MALVTHLETTDVNVVVETQHSRPYNHERPLTAAAARIDVNNKKDVERLKQRHQTDTWQTDAWDFFDLIGEVKYTAMLIGSIMSRVRLYPAMITGPDVIPSGIDKIEGLPDGFVEACHSALRKLATANGGLPGILRDSAMNMFIAGECYLVQTPAKPALGLAESWKIKSVSELVPLGNGFGIKSRRNARANDIEPVPANAFMGRIWRTHPRYSDEADSSMRAVLDLCDELLLLSRTVRATARSRLNAGAIFVPDGLSVAGGPDGESSDSADDPDSFEPYADDDSDSFEEDLMNALSTPIQDEASASAVVPFIIRGPAETGAQIKVIKFERSFDPQLAQRADVALDRILSGLDVPKDAVAGIKNLRFSTGVQIEDSLYKQHVEPMALSLCDAYTVVFFQPLLRMLGFDEKIVERAVIWYDPTAIAAKPDRATAADSGLEKRAISNATWRRAHGFAETDAPSPLETMMRVAIERGQLSEPITEALFKLMAPDLLEQVRQQSQDANPSPMTPDLQSALGNAGAAPDAPDDSGADGSSIPAPDTPPSTQPTQPSQQTPAAPAAPGGLLEP